MKNACKHDTYFYRKHSHTEFQQVSLGATNSKALLLHYFTLINGEAPPRGQKIFLVWGNTFTHQQDTDAKSANVTVRSLHTGACPCNRGIS